jgi:hypothetical protein
MEILSWYYDTLWFYTGIVVNTPNLWYYYAAVAFLIDVVLVYDCFKHNNDEDNIPAALGISIISPAILGGLLELFLHLLPIVCISLVPVAMAALLHSFVHRRKKGSSTHVVVQEK